MTGVNDSAPHRLRTAWRENRSVVVVSATLLVVLLATSREYGFHRDEFYIRESGRHPAWGYPDHPPLSPLLARIADELAPDSLLALRAPAALGAAVTVLLIGWIAREFGGDRRAQFLAAIIAAGSILVLTSGHLLTTASIDVVFATSLTFLLARMIRTGDTRLWAAAGVVLGLGLLNRVFLVVYAVVLVGAVALAGPRKMLHGSWFPVGVVTAVVIAAPTVLWQAANGWPQWEMATAISADNSRWELLANQAVIVGPLLLPLWLAGLWWLLRHPPMRCFGIAYLGMLALLMITSGATHYLFAAYPALLAAAGIVTAGWLSAATGRLRALALTALITVSAANSAVFTLPVLPVSMLADVPVVDMNKEVGEQIGWPEMGRAVAEVVDRLPADTRSTTVVVADNYGQAGAVAHFGPGFAADAATFPPVHSGHQAYAWWGPPAERFTTAVVLGTDAPSTAPPWTERACGELTEVATVFNEHGVGNTENGTRIFLCEDLTVTWTELWPQIRRVGPRSP